MHIKRNFITRIVKKSISKQPKKKIRTRFPPEPNGYLHLGHAKSIYLNFNIAKKYNGVCTLRFDDTNPKKENIKYIDAIKKDIQWLGLNLYKEPKYTSQYFYKLYKYAIQLIRNNLAYVEELNKKEIKKYRGSLKTPGKNSPFRNRTIEENLLLFKKMKSGIIPEGSMCLRAKINMKSPCMVLRDPVLYRIIFTKHHQTNHEWCIYPMYDFAHCIADALEGITHSLCTLEFQDNRQLYDWILKKLNLNQKPPKQYEFAKLNLEYAVLSKRKLQELIDKKIVQGWEDPRLHTLSGLRNKGYTSNSIKMFCEKIGITKQQNIIELSLLESCIRKDLNMTSPRRMAVINPIKIVIENIPKNHIEYFSAPNHPQIKEMGTRTIMFSQKIYIEKEDFRSTDQSNYKGLILGKKVRLKYACLIKAKKILKNQNNEIAYIVCKYYPEKTKKNKNQKKKYNIIHWISQKSAIPADFQLFDTLFTTKTPEKEKKIIPFYNPQSLIKKKGYIESIIETEIVKHAYQFERIGYFLKKNTHKKHKKYIFNRIVSLKNKYRNFID
ncbi:glutamine--tRNA ligase/YqeY domain fusion protein [Buchnera aphidicola]|uniref:glutamine--tRNA ligase/YqeY domain fusion protein n=1 Tax=Buchnera aphidicola TaxID=9 RepID=UPI00094DB9D4|nr:glutamine--tRNA ligase/YqeY domain fusion protein [Buchnera aphidicola]